jgi:hypothetical protein
MRPSAQDRARRLAALEASLASELTHTRTMTLAVATAARPTELEPAVGAWLADWTDYHAGRAASPVTRDLIPVAMDQISVQRVTAIVWHCYQQEWAASETAAVNVAMAAGAEGLTAGPEVSLASAKLVDGLPAIRIPARFSPRLKTSIDVGGQPRRVPPSVATALLEIAEGAELVRFRKETHLAILQALPEVGPHLVRQGDRKVIANRHTYRPSDELRRCLRVQG